MTHIFKAGDRVWFEGRKYSLELKSSVSAAYPFFIRVGYDGTFYFTDDGRLCSDSPKPSLKPVKRKERRRVWLIEQDSTMMEWSLNL